MADADDFSLYRTLVDEVLLRSPEMCGAPLGAVLVAHPVK